jgi:hypothetical protein
MNKDVLAFSTRMKEATSFTYSLVEHNACVQGSFLPYSKNLETDINHEFDSGTMLKL